MSDQIEKSLQEMAGKLKAAWTANQCLTCPLGELAALAAATLTFYQEHQRTQQVNEVDHWTNYRKRHLTDPV